MAHTRLRENMYSQDISQNFFGSVYSIPGDSAQKIGPPQKTQKEKPAYFGGGGGGAPIFFKFFLTPLFFFLGNLSTREH